MRVLHLRPRFRADLARLAPRGTPAWTAVSKTLRELVDADIEAPGRDDIAVNLPPSVVGRPVPGTNLVIAYVPVASEIHLLALRRLVPA